MIKDTIDNGDTEDAKMWISDLQDELYDVSCKTLAPKVWDYINE